MHFLQKVIIGIPIILGKLSIISNSYGHDFDEAERAESRPQIENQNSEMVKQFAEFLEARTQTGTKGAEVKPKVRDKNFDIIDAGRDELRQIFDSYQEILDHCPSDFKLAIDCISNSIFERKIIFQNVMFQSSEMVDKAISALSEILNEYNNIFPQIYNTVILLRCANIIVEANPGIVENLHNKDSITPLTQNDAEEMYEKIEPMIKYSNEGTKAMIKSIFINAVKNRFEEKPNIPSYYAFHLIKNILDMLDKTEKDMKQATFNRSFENAVYSMQKLSDELNNFLKSDQIAKNIMPFMNGAKKTLTSQIDFIQKKAREWREYMATLEIATRQVKDILKQIIEADKDQSIFDNINEVQFD